jgi:hypothetical protein
MDESPKASATDAPPEEERVLLDYLTAHDVACPSCTYNLRGLTTPRCPECGHELKLNVWLTEPYLRAWIVLAMAVFGSAGVGALFSIVLVHGPWPRRLIYDIAIVYFIANLPIAIIVTIGRRHFMRWPMRRQWSASVLAWGMTLVGFGLFALTLFD